MRNRSILIMLLAIAALSSCRHRCMKGSGQAKTESRKVADFTRIELSGNFRVHLKQDSSMNVAINADDNLLPEIKTTVSGGKLQIKMKREICSGGDITINIGVRNLEAIESSGNDEVTTDDTLHVKDLALSSSGKGNYTLNLMASNVNTNVSGVMELNLKGQAASHNVAVSGVAKIHAFDFVAGNYGLETSGMGSYEVNALTNIRISSSGVSKVIYKGNPTINESKTGTSTVEKAK